MNTKKLVYNSNELKNFLLQECKKDLCYTVSIIFNQVYLYPYKYASKIPYNDYSISYNHQYYKNGIWYNFPIKSIIKYQNTDGGD